MKTDDLYIEIKKSLPQIIFVTGKTSTGKTTFANKLHTDLGYEIIELDKVVRESVVINNPDEKVGDIFMEVYKNRDRLDWINAFVELARERIVQSKGLLVVDGAIANHETLQEVFADLDFKFVFFHPEDKDKYTQMLTERFVNGAHDGTTGLPNYFWSLVEEADLTEFLENGGINEGLHSAIEAFSESSVEKSSDRYAYFMEHFSDIEKTWV